MANPSVAFSKSPIAGSLAYDVIELADMSSDLPAHVVHVTDSVVITGPKVHIVGVGAQTEVIVWNMSNSYWASVDSIDADDINLGEGNAEGDHVRVLWRGDTDAATFHSWWATWFEAEDPTFTFGGSPYYFGLGRTGTYHIYEILYVMSDTDAEIFLGVSATLDLVVTNEWNYYFGRVLCETNIPKATIDMLIQGLPAACITAIDAGWQWACGPV